MRLYLCIILLSDLLLWLGNGASASGALYTVGGTVGVILLDGVFAFLIRRLPECWIGSLSLAAGGQERRFYKKIKIRQWKDHIPELGQFTGFRKDHIEYDPKYLDRFLLEARYGILIHLQNALCGLLLLPLLPPAYAWTIAGVNAVLSLLPAMVLRYHISTLQYLARKLAK